MPLECTLDLKYITFFKSIATSENKIINYIANSMIHSHASTLSKNIRYLTYKYDVNIDDILSSSRESIRKYCYNTWLDGIDKRYPAHAGVVKDMLGIKEERNTRIFSNDECNAFIESLYTI